MTDERLKLLRDVLLAHPGDDDVLIDTQRNVVVLRTLRVDALSRELHRAIRCACQRQVMVHVLDDAELWP